MKRRDSFSALLKPSKTKAIPPPTGSLNPYTGPWSVQQASHLLRRTIFGPDQEMIDESLALGLDRTISALFENAVPNSPPVIYTLPEPPPGGGGIFPVFDDPYVPYGETWINEPPLQDTGDPQLNIQINVGRTRSALSWPFVNMMQPGLNIMSKMWMFWHNHFVVSDIFFPLSYYQYAKVLEDNAIGDFKEMTKAITTDVGMLFYLNGQQNSKEAPNENYARELLELFTVGKGELAGPGDYTTFTEQDVREMARVLTGWQLNGAELNTKLESRFNSARHDTGTKILSHRFDNAVINNAAIDEYSQLIDIIFQQDVVSKFICRKLYRYFVNYEIDDHIELTIIEPLAKILRDDNYNIENAIRTLLSSEHFYGEEAIGCMIKNPADFVLSATRGLNMQLSGDPANDYFFSTVFYIFASDLDMKIFQHQDVAGWKAYYQAPQYYRNWINTYYLPQRNQTSTSLVAGGPVSFDGNQAMIPQLINVVQYIATIDNAFDANSLITGITQKLFAYPISTEQKDYLKEILIPGLPDFEWTVEYNDYLSDPLNTEKYQAINNKLVQLFTAILEMPEFQLM